MNIQIENIAKLNSIIGIYLIPVVLGLITLLIWIISHIINKYKKRKKFIQSLQKASKEDIEATKERLIQKGLIVPGSSMILCARKTHSKIPIIRTGYEDHPRYEFKSNNSSFNVIFEDGGTMEDSIVVSEEYANFQRQKNAILKNVLIIED